MRSCESAIQPSRVPGMNNDTPLIKELITAGGKIRCMRCQAMSKRTRLQCGAAAMKGKRVCYTHGGKSTGPKTTAGGN